MIEKNCGKMYFVLNMKKNFIFSCSFFSRTALLVVILSLFSLQAVFSREFSENEKQAVQEIFSFRLSLRSLPDVSSCAEKLREYKNQNREKIESLGEEARLTCDNMLATAEYNLEYEKDIHSPEMEKILRPQYQKILEFSKGKSAEELNPYFVLTSSDLTNSMLQFLPRSYSITLGLQEKKDYAVVVKNNPEMSFALTLSAWWYYYAPSVGGGSESKAREFFELAQKSAVSDYDKYYSCINLAQFHFEKKNSELCDKYMEEAEKILPETRYVKLLRRINKIGYSLFDYNMNSRREKIDKKLIIDD